MSQPTRQEIIRAYSALDDLRDNALEWEGVKAQKQYHAVLKILPPIPKPTMAEVEWDNRKHFLAVVEVDHEKYKRAIMLRQDVPGEVIECFALHPNKCVVGYFSPDMLTLTGKSYTLTEVQE